LTYLAGMLKSDDDVLIFVTAHELAHFQLGHHQKRMGVSAATTYAMLVVNSVVPGAGLLNRAINPAITNNFSKTQELDADGAAAKACMRCLGFSKEKVIEIMQRKKNMAAADGGGFWDKHPSWDERIAHVEGLLTTAVMPQTPASSAK
jgi:Zn-dependent protease with chaperone function